MRFSEPDLGLLIVGHGTRDARGKAAFLETVRQVEQRLPGVPIEPCFLELARPSIEEGVERLVGRQARRMIVMPLMLFAAGHVHRDIPNAVLKAASRFPHTEVRFARHLGLQSQLVELSHRRSEETLRRRPAVPPEQTGLVFAGRGSHEPQAIAEMREFVELRRRMARVAWAEVGFLAMARPSLAEILAAVAVRPVRRIFVQPHLLFPGFLWQSARSLVQEFADRQREIDWVTVEPLGPDRQLAESVISVVLDTLSEVKNCGAHPAVKVRI